MRTKFFLTAIIAAFVMTSAAAQTTLQLNLQKGETYYQSSKANPVITISIQGMSIAISTLTDSKLAYKVVNVEGDNYEMEVKYERIKNSTTTPQVSLSYSSEDPKDAISSAFAEITKHSFNVKMNKYGEILEVRNYDKLIDTAISQNSNLFDTEKQQIMQTFSEDLFKQSMGSLFAIYPKTAVTKGGNWETASATTAGGVSINATAKYTLIESNNNYNKVSGTYTLKNAPDAEPIYDPSMGGSVKYKLSGTGDAEIILDATSGWITEATMNQYINGELEVMDDMAGGMNIPMNINITNNLSNK